MISPRKAKHLDAKTMFTYSHANTLIGQSERAYYLSDFISHNLNTQNVKIARRDRPHILASNWCETFENLLHIDIAPLKRTLSGILHSKN